MQCFLYGHVQHIRCLACLITTYVYQLRLNAQKDKWKTIDYWMEKKMIGRQVKLIAIKSKDKINSGMLTTLQFSTVF